MTIIEKQRQRKEKVMVSDNGFFINEEPYSKGKINFNKFRLYSPNGYLVKDAFTMDIAKSHMETLDFFVDIQNNAYGGEDLE
mgnify:CR=1 FL=1